ncbi:MarR family transcriptional regulator [Agrobacterium rhizogenes]|uniref:MarR family winged helix-turn-helix transcriptional regulator n=1 Tax=Rhizobium rhizogenes TaxID=359 RepID=UPI0006918C48|nr:MarR family transcriptional regulator [Rhizobium rhizogenes]MDJ1638456.1 MarR family transcriptional regulator [Rhizobium rhizogenes]NTG74638.1 MarR family transcriptional regulator [Rhizobium rhizogenes]NTG87303.1 MarR family transcriptional regulator [Rhizobium rhizogenes]
MSIFDELTKQPNTSEELQPPFFGALLRIVWQDVRNRMHKAIHDAGFTDFQDAHFAVFSYPLPDGIRPSELARQKRMSRQAINYLIIQLEELGYVERRAPESSDRRLIYLSAQGQEIAETIFTCLRKLHAEWAEEIGHERFDVFLDVLKQLSLKAQESTPEVGP